MSQGPDQQGTGPELPRRRLGRSSVEVSCLGIGTGSQSHAEGAAGVAATLDRALASGARYLDTAPLYLDGASERRVGSFLRRHGRSDVVVSTKVGRLADGPPSGPPGGPGRRRFDYSAAGTRDSVVSSLERLGLERIDVVVVHDIDAAMHGPDFETQYRRVVQECYPVLASLRAEGRIGALGVSARQSEVCLRAMADMSLDCLMMAGSYTLLRHEPAQELFGACRQQGVSVLVASPFNTGILATGDPQATFDYAPPGAEVLDRVRRLREVADRHRVPLAAAALQFPLREPAVASVVVGQRSPREVDANVRALLTDVPPAFWTDLAADGLVPSPREETTAPSTHRPTGGPTP